MALVGATALLCLTACGGGSDDEQKSLSGDEQKAADNLAAQIEKTGNVGTEQAVTADQAKCVGEGTVRRIGLDALESYGILQKDLSVNKGIQGVKLKPKDADSLAAVFVDCIDAEKLFEKQFLRNAGGDKTSDEQRTCIEDAVDPKSVQQVLSLSFQGQTNQVYTDLQRRLAACLQPGSSPAPSAGASQ